MHADRPFVVIAIDREIVWHVFPCLVQVTQSSTHALPHHLQCALLAFASSHGGKLFEAIAELDKLPYATQAGGFGFAYRLVEGTDSHLAALNSELHTTTVASFHERPLLQQGNCTVVVRRLLAWPVAMPGTFQRVSVSGTGIRNLVHEIDHAWRRAAKPPLPISYHNSGTPDSSR